MGDKRFEGVRVRSVALVNEDEVRQFGLLADPRMHLLGETREIYWVEHGDQGREPHQRQDVFFSGLVNEFDRVGQTGRLDKDHVRLECCYLSQRQSEGPADCAADAAIRHLAHSVALAAQ